MGNVSRRVRSLHPWFPLPGVTSAIHSGGYTDAAGTDAAYDAMSLAATALARAVAPDQPAGVQTMACAWPNALS